MIQYEVNLNNGVEAFGTGKTITANEVLLTCDEKALAREIHHQNSLIPEDVAASVLGYFGKAAAQLMADSEGYSVERKAVKEVAYVAKKGSDADDDNTQTGAGGGGNNNPPSGELEG